VPKATLNWLCLRLSNKAFSILFTDCWSSARVWISTDFWEMESCKHQISTY